MASTINNTKDFAQGKLYKTNSGNTFMVVDVSPEKMKVELYNVKTMAKIAMVYDTEIPESVGVEEIVSTDL